MHTPTKPNPRKTNPTQNAPNTAKRRQSVNKPPKEQKKVVEHTVPNKNKWSAERYFLNAEGDKGHTGSRAGNARRNGNVTDVKLGEQRATQRKQDRREVERAVRDGTETGRTGSRVKTRNSTKRDGGKEREGNEVEKNYVSRPQQKLNQTN